MKLVPKIVTTLLWSLCLLCLHETLVAQGAIINEFSNGPAGNQEYFELVVVGPTATPNCGPVDLRGWILDDNNGDFSCGACAGTGIAQGHIRFGNLPVWSAVPTGSIIVLYDAGVKNPRIPADDPNDSSPADGVYILSMGHASIDASSTPCASPNLPTAGGACGSCSGNSNYTGVCYTAGFPNSNTGLRNTGDAPQVRQPSGAYFHGVGYGTVASLITGGPDNLLVAGDGTGRYYGFMNTVDNNFRSVANFGSGTVASNGETPGTGNSANNIGWILSLQVPCILPVNYYSPLTVKPGEGTNRLQWSTASEINSSRWEVLRAYTLEEGFQKIGEVAAAGTSTEILHYEFTDDNPQQPKVWYQLRQMDMAGTTELSNMVQVVNRTVPGTFIDIWPNPGTGIFQLRAASVGLRSLRVMDLTGRVVLSMPIVQELPYFETELDLRFLPAGNYLLQLQGDQGALSRRIVLQPR